LEADVSDARKKVLADFIEKVWNQGDLDAAGRYLAPAYLIAHDPGDPWDGRTLDAAQFRERLAQARTPFPDQRFETVEMIADGDAVVMTWFWSATHSGEVAGYPATGRQIRMSGATVYRFDAENRITGHWQIKDALGVFQQLSRAT
jgi:steroid delta-isomerase-like uncharacterized protein